MTILKSLKLLLKFHNTKNFLVLLKKKMKYSKKIVDKTSNCICVTDKRKIDILLKMDASQYTNLGLDSTAKEKEQVRSNSNYIYQKIKEIDEALGDSFLKHQD